MKNSIAAILLAAGVLLPALAQAQVPTVLKLPPVQVSAIAQGMGNAVGADGTLFNATSFNPALLSRAPHGVEAFGLGLNVSNDVFGLIDYLQNIKFSANDDFKAIAHGALTSNATEVNQGLGDVQDLLKHLTNKAVEAGAGANVAVRINKNWGFQVYSSLHAFSQIWSGALSNSLMGIPLDNNSPTAVAQSLGILQGDVQSQIDLFITPSQQSSLTADINALKNGTESLDQFKQNVQATFPSGIDVDALGRAILNKLTDDMGILTGLAYLDTVVMGTYSFQPFEGELPGLTVGGNLKIVNRRISYDRFSFNDSNIGDRFVENLKQTTTRWGFDLGAVYELPNLPLDFGLSIQDLFHAGANVPAASDSLLAGFVSDPAPTMVALSASWHPAPGLRVNGEVDDLFSSSTLYDGKNGASRIRMGAAYTLGGFFNVRAGFGDQNIGLGAGIMAGFFGLDYSYGADTLSQSMNHYAQMRFVF